MAMTKKERAEFDAAIHRAELLAALRWTDAVEKDVPPPINGSDKFTTGWRFNSYSMRVDQAWSGSNSNGSGNPPNIIENKYRSASQGGVWLYSTEQKAYAAMRHEIELESAKKLLQCDKEIRAE